LLFLSCGSDDCIYVSGSRPRALGTRVFEKSKEGEPYRVERSQNKSQFGARAASFNANDPLPAYANTPGERCLVQGKVFAPVAENGS
jgi:hypothetical protein